MPSDTSDFLQKGCLLFRGHACKYLLHFRCSFYPCSLLDLFSMFADLPIIANCPDLLYDFLGGHGRERLYQRFYTGHERSTPSKSHSSIRNNIALYSSSVNAWFFVEGFH